MKGNTIMKNGKLQVALVGCGMIAHAHADAVILDGRAEIVALVRGRDPEKGRAFAEKYNIPFVTDDYNEVIARGGIDMVIIASPSSYHCDCAIAFANAGIQILCEKPLDVKIEKMSAMIEAAEKNNILMGCVFPNRVQSGIINAKKLIESGELGEMYTFEFQYRGFRSHKYYSDSYWRGSSAINGGGFLINQGSHGVDALIHLVGDVKKVCAVCETKARNIDGEDTAVALLELENGVHGTLMGTVLSHFPETNSECERIRIEFEHGTLIFADGKTVVHKSLSEDELKTEEIQLSDDVLQFGDRPEDIDMGAHNRIVSNFIDGLLLGAPLIAPARDARRSIDLILTIYESSKTKSWLEVPKF